MINAQKAIDTTLSTTAKIGKSLSTQTGQAATAISRVSSAALRTTGKGIERTFDATARGFDKTLYGIERVADKTFAGIERGFDKTLSALETGVDKTFSGIEKGVDAMGRGFDKSIDSIERGFDASMNFAERTWDAAANTSINLANKGANIASKGISEAGRYAAIGAESTFVAGLAAYDAGRKFASKASDVTRKNASTAWDATSKKAVELSEKAKIHGGHAIDVTSKTATQAWNSSKAAAQDMSWEKVQVQSGQAVQKLNSKIAYEQLSAARKNENTPRFAAILAKQNGDTAFTEKLTQDDADFMAVSYAQAIRDHDKRGSDYAASLLTAAKPYPIFEDALANVVNSQIDAAFRLNNQGRSPETRQAYRSLSLMFNQAGENPAYLAKVEPEKLKRVHAAGKSMGYKAEASEILLYARKAQPSLVAAFCPQDIAGAVRTQKVELGVSELPQDMTL